MQNPEWFKDWFNSPYYHILYKNRNYNEAAAFIDKLSAYLKLAPSDKIWDLACGKGRHSYYLNSKGFCVTGTDLSENNIKEASAHENPRLEFFVHDMRKPFRINYFTHVLNLFTSIGYFEDSRDNFKVFQNVHRALRPAGVFVVDFFNSDFVEKHIIPSEVKEIEGIKFTIGKRIENKHVVKSISFTDKGHAYQFEESVSLLHYEDFLSFADKAGFRLRTCFGNYNLEPFNRQASERLILIFEK